MMMTDRKIDTITSDSWVVYEIICPMYISEDRNHNFYCLKKIEKTEDQSIEETSVPTNKELHWIEEAVRNFLIEDFDSNWYKEIKKHYTQFITSKILSIRKEFDDIENYDQRNQDRIAIIKKNLLPTTNTDD